MHNEMSYFTIIFSLQLNTFQVMSIIDFSIDLINLVTHPPFNRFLIIYLGYSIKVKPIKYYETLFILF